MPDSTIPFRVVILWTHEVRIAARALNQLRSENAKDLPDGEYTARANTALRACMAALWDLSLLDEKNPIIMCEKPNHAQIAPSEETPETNTP